MSNSIITIVSDTTTISFEYTPSKHYSLAQILHNHGYNINTPCGGNSLCGKCNILVNDNLIKSCQYYPSDDITIKIPDTSLIQEFSYETHSQTSPSGIYNAAIDVGSTSITICLIINTQITDSISFYNPTAAYGADIVSRQQASIQGNLNAMYDCLLHELSTRLTTLIRKKKLNLNALNDIIIACNSTMQHILLGIDCSDIAAYPFTVKPHDTFLYILNKKAYLIPSFTAFIGGDIISGMYYLSDRNSYIFLDLGTNAEMVLYDSDIYYCTSAAAGPAFESSSIECGCAYVPGAIYSITLRKKLNNTYDCVYKTIDNKLPIGICGSGILELYSELITNNIIDEFGTLNDSYSDLGFMVTSSVNGKLYISQNDIRQLQLAIAAIKTGIEILLQKSSHKASDIHNVYIAGSFGQSLNVNILKVINMFPAELLHDKNVHFCGNTSLKGAVKYANTSNNPFKKIIAECKEIHLSNEPDFNDLFINNMNR